MSGKRKKVRPPAHASDAMIDGNRASCVVDAALFKSPLNASLDADEFAKGDPQKWDLLVASMLARIELGERFVLYCRQRKAQQGWL